MPFAWTHRLVKYKYDADFDTALHMSDDGYARPDNSNFCYIGFHWGSAALNQTVDGVPYWWWVEHFFAYALNENWLVKWALNEASQQFYNSNFGETKLYTGFTAIWPMYRNGDWQFEGQGIEGTGYMKVYGNGNIKLYQPLLTLSASGGLSPNFYLDGHQQGIGSVRLISKFYQFNVDDIHNYEFSHVDYNGYTFGRPANIQVASDGILTAVYTWDPTYYTLSISAGEGGTTKSPYTPDDYQLLSYTYAHVEADPDDDWILDKWLLDGDDAGSNLSIDVLMDEPHTLEAVFAPNPSYQYVLSIYDAGGAVYDAENLVGWKPDGQFATIEGWGPYQYYGWIIGAMNEPAAGHIYMYGCGNGPLFVYASNDPYNWNLVSTPYVDSSSPYWIDCGSPGFSFNYIAVTAEHWNYIYYVSLDSVRVETPTYHTLTISSSGDGYTVPSGNPEYPSDTYAHVEAHADPGWAFDNWSLDGDDAGTNPAIDVYMDDDRRSSLLHADG
jgi:hypothetical protein